MNQFEKNDLTRRIVEAKQALEHGQKDPQRNVDFLENVKSLFEQHPQLMESDELRKIANARDEELRGNGISDYADRYQQISDELSGIVDPVADALAAAISDGDVDKAEACVRVMRTGRLVPETTPEQLGPEDGPDDQTAIGIMGTMRAPSQVLMAQARQMKESLK